MALKEGLLRDANHEKPEIEKAADVVSAIFLQVC